MPKYIHQSLILSCINVPEDSAKHLPLGSRLSGNILAGNSLLTALLLDNGWQLETQNQEYKSNENATLYVCHLVQQEQYHNTA